MSSSYALYSSSNDEVAFGNGGRRRRGVFLSLPIIIAAVVVVVVCIVSVGLIVGLTVKNCPEQESTTKVPDTTLTTKVTKVTPTPTPTPTPAPVNIRLPTDILPEAYTVVLAPFLYDSNSDAFYFTGSVDIQVSVEKATKKISLHRHKDMNVTTGYTVVRNANEVNVEGVDYKSVEQWDELTLKDTLNVGDNVTIKAEFRAPLRPDMKGLYLSSYTKNGATKYIATSQLQSVDARKTFPCFDEPKFKATFEVTMVRLKAYKSISNMPSVENKTADCKKWFGDFSGSCVEEKFEPTPRMSTYLLAFIVSEFDFIDETDNKGRLYRNWARPEFTGIAEYAMEAVVNITNYFEGFYNVAYPLNKTDQAAVPDFNAGAMENWGLIIYRESRMLFDESKDTSAIKQAIGSVISHELAHMWFGNLVTPDWWDDVWLNEGFASFTQNLGVDQLHPDWDIDAQFVSSQQRTAFNVDSKGASHPIFMPILTTTDIESIFDSITYRKGASVLRQMYYFLGEEVFKTGIGNYLKNNSYSNAFHTALYENLQQAVNDTGRTLNVSAVMERWILQMGHPVVTCSRQGDRLLLEQDHFLSDPSQTPDPRYPSDFGYEWIIPITMATDKNASKYTNTKEISGYVEWMTEKKQNFSIDGSPDWYLLNLRSAGFYRINYDVENWQKLIDQLNRDHTVFAPHDRARIIEDSFALAAANNLSYSIPMNVTKYLKNETHYVPWQSALSQLSYLHTMLHRQSPEYGPFSAYMRDLLKPKFEEFNITISPSGHLEKQLQSLIVTSACLYGITECEKQASDLFEEFEKADYNATVIIPDVRSRVLCEGVASSFVVQWDNLFKAMNKEDHPGMRNDMLRALACSSEPWILNRFLDYAINDSMVRRQDSSTVFSSVSANPNGLQIVWDFLREKWDVIREQMPGSFTIAYFVQNLSRFNTKQKLGEIEAFKRDNADNLGSAARQMDLSIEDVKINIQWMESNLEELKQWLNENVEYNP